MFVYLELQDEVAEVNKRAVRQLSAQSCAILKRYGYIVKMPPYQDFVLKLAVGDIRLRVWEGQGKGSLIFRGRPNLKFAILILKGANKFNSNHNFRP